MSIELREEIHRLHAQLCSALADPSRILILYTLASGSINVSDLAEDVGLSQPSVSRHLKVLRDAGWLTGTVQGPATSYCLNEGNIAWFRIKVGEIF